MFDKDSIKRAATLGGKIRFTNKGLYTSNIPKEKVNEFYGLKGGMDLWCRPIKSESIQDRTLVTLVSYFKSKEEAEEFAEDLKLQGAEGVSVGPRTSEGYPVYSQLH